MKRPKRGTWQPFSIAWLEQWKRGKAIRWTRNPWTHFSRRSNSHPSYGSKPVMAAHDRMPQMTTIKAKAFYMLVGVALTVFVLYPTLKQTFREQKDGLLLSPEEVKSTCGKPQVDDLYTLTYV